MDYQEIEEEPREKSNIEKVKEHINYLDCSIFPNKIKNADEYELRKDIDSIKFNDAELFGIAAHQVRYRIQDEKIIESLFVKNNLYILDDPKLVCFQNQNNKISKEVLAYLDNGRMEKGRKLNKKELDATVIEILTIMLRKKGVSKEEILEYILTKEPKDIKKNLTFILKT